MTDLQLLFMVLALLYGWECACWLPRGSVSVCTWLGRRWRAVHPGVLLGNQRGGFIFAAPLPPLGAIVTGNQLPVSLSGDAALAYVSASINPGWRPPQTGRLCPFDQMTNVAARGKKVLINGELFCKASSAPFAHYLARLLL